MTVCHGNICRSAMAEIVLVSLIESQGLQNEFEVASSGVSSEEQGNGMDYRAVETLLNSGYSQLTSRIDKHRASKITRTELEEFDLFLPMTFSQERVLEQWGVFEDKVYLWRAFENVDSNFKPVSKDAPDLEDPWYGGSEDFKTALSQLESSAKTILEFAKLRAKGNSES